MTAVAYETALEFASPLAVALWRQYPGVDIDDIRQELCEWFWRNPRKAREYLNHEDAKQGERMIGAALMNRGRRYCLRERAHQTGYRFEDLAWYTEEQLDKELLPAMFSPEAWANPPQAERSESSTRQDPAHGGNWIASLADCADAYRRLSAEDRRLLELRYADDVPQTRIAKDWGESDQWISDALARARARMVRHLGGERPVYEADEIPVGSRRAMSNAAAQAATRQSWEGE